jgi:Uma2 family endonuclease
LTLLSDDGIVVVGGRKEYVVRTSRTPPEIVCGRPRTMTTEEYLRTPETVLPQELVYGALRVADAPLPRHQRAVASLFRALDVHVSERHLGEVWLSPIDVILDAERHLVVQPDLLFISNARSQILLDRIRGAPDLVVEVLSPGPRIGHVRERIAWFAEYGVAECWLVDLMAARVEVLAFADGAVAERRSFNDHTPLVSRVLPLFTRTLGSVLGY